MLAVQAAHREESSAVADEEAIARDTKLSHEAKRGILQKSLHMAASNGDMDQVHRLVKGPAKEYIDVDAADEEGTAPLIYASCFVSIAATEPQAHVLGPPRRRRGIARGQGHG